jgi:hypothetical protein
MLTIPVDISDLRKIKRAMEFAEHYHRATDEANACRHAALNEGVIHSPLTSLLRAELERLDRLMGFNRG